jgi:O-antigen biosynthesis protein
MFALNSQRPAGGPYEYEQNPLMNIIAPRQADILLAEIMRQLDTGEELFWAPERVVQFEHWVGHIPFAFWLVKTLRPRTILELGTHRGNSYCAFCQAIATLQLNAQAFAVDTWKGDIHMAPEVGVLEDLQAYHDPRFGSFSTLLRMTFDEAREMIEDRSIDLLHIDGAHTYEAVKHDFENWTSALSSRSVVLFHDTCVRRDEYGVWRLWNELSAKHPSFEFRHSFGLGVLGVGEDLPVTLRNLFTMSEDDRRASTVRAVFASSGGAHVRTLTISQLEQDLKAERDNAARQTLAVSQLEVDLKAERDSAGRQTLAVSQLEVDLKAERDNAARQTIAISQLEQDLKAERDDAARVARDSTAQNRRLSEEVANLQTQLHAFTTSTVWRATWPIRRVVAAIPAPIRRFARRALKLGWWIAMLPTKLAAPMSFRFRSLLKQRAHLVYNATPARFRRCIRSLLHATQDLRGTVERVFDKDYYLRVCGERIEADQAYAHFATVGNVRLVSPTPLFLPSWYASRIGKSGLTSIELLTDYFKQKGTIDPHPLFDSNYYRRMMGLSDGVNPLLHYLENAPARVAKGAPVSPTPFFVPDFYLRQNKDVAEAGMDPFLHYLIWGYAELRQPSPYFSPRWYVSRYPDVESVKLEPLTHFITVGIGEGRSPHHLIDIAYYLLCAPDVAKANLDPYRHFVEYGDRENRSPHPVFDPQFYRANGVDIGSVPPFAHYVEHGVRQLRSPCPAFDPVHYIVHYPHDADDPLLHLLLDVRHNRSHFHPLLDGNYQRLTAYGAANGLNPLVEYVRYRSHFSAENLKRDATGIPRPTRALASHHKPQGAVSESLPKVSIIVPCYKSNLSYLKHCIDSVIVQTCKNWELILVDDGSPDEATWPALQTFEKRDVRIRVLKLNEHEGISGATNAGIRASGGEFLAFLDHDDVITRDALFTMMSTLIERNYDAAYSDQAFLGSENAVEEPCFKPSWSPALFTGAMYVGHLLIVRKSIAENAGLFKSQFDGCQDFEFMLRVSEQTGKILHIPKILYYWRRSEGSVAMNSHAKGNIERKQAMAVYDHFDRIGFDGSCEPDKRVPHRLRIWPRRLKETVVLDIIVQRSIDNLSHFESRLNAAGARIGSLQSVDCTRLPAACAAGGKSPWILFLEPNVNFVDDRWLRSRLMYACCADVAFVASHIYEPNGMIVSAGLVATTKKGLVASYSGYRGGQDGTWGTLLCDREVSAVDGTCTVISRERLDSIGGLSRDYASVGGAVSEASYRATVSGLRNISLAARLIELSSAQEHDLFADAIDHQIFLDTYSERLKKGDRYYNPNFTPNSANFNAG